MRVVITLALLSLLIMPAACAKQTTQENAVTSASATPTQSSAQGAAAAPGATSSNVAMSVAYTDISGTFAEQAIKDLGALGVFDSTSGAFHPNDPVKRADFVRWLVKANNIFYKADATQQIRLAAGNEATFVDLPPSNTDFKYIQGMTNAGYVIGTDAKHFAPDQKLTREQMIAIKAARDAGGSNSKDVSQQFLTMRLGKTDTTQIAKPYWGAFYDDFSAATSGNFNRVYGSVKIFNPKKAVTRGEAALALSVFGGEIPERKAAQMLGQPSK